MKLKDFPMGELGQGAFAVIDGLKLVVKITPQGWGYSIFRGQSAEEHHTCWPGHDDNEDDARIEAITKALKILGRGGDLAAIASGLKWTPL